MKYKKRILDEILEFRLKTKGAILITGPKWCGKTTTAMQKATSFINMQDPFNKRRNIEMAELNPLEILEGNVPRLIDEWQVAPHLWDSIRQEVDKRQMFGQFILTGSSVPIKMDSLSHSGAGRIVSIQMRPMSLYESLDSNGTISLKTLFENELYNNTTKSPLSFADITFLICRGGWPMAVDLESDVALQQAIDFYDVISTIDIKIVDGVNRSKQRASELLKSYARHISTSVPNSTILADVNAKNSVMTRDTVSDYLEAFRKMYIIEELDAWNPNFRSKTAIRTSPTRHFVDPSIATSALGMSPKDLVKDIKTCGLLFESLCVRDLRIYTDALKGKVFKYHDSTGLEIDAIIHLNDGKWAAIEVKLGHSEIPNAIKNLERLKNKIDANKTNEPSFLMVLTATEYAYKHESGVWIVPLGCLKN